MRARARWRDDIRRIDRQPERVADAEPHRDCAGLLEHARSIGVHRLQNHPARLPEADARRKDHAVGCGRGARVAGDVGRGARDGEGADRARHDGAAALGGDSRHRVGGVRARRRRPVEDDRIRRHGGIEDWRSRVDEDEVVDGRLVPGAVGHRAGELFDPVDRRMDLLAVGRRCRSEQFERDQCRVLEADERRQPGVASAVVARVELDVDRKRLVPPRITVGRGQRQRQLRRRRVSGDVDRHRRLRDVALRVGCAQRHRVRSGRRRDPIERRSTQSQRDAVQEPRQRRPGERAVLGIQRGAVVGDRRADAVGCAVKGRDDLRIRGLRGGSDRDVGVDVRERALVDAVTRRHDDPRRPLAAGVLLVEGEGECGDGVGQISVAEARRDRVEGVSRPAAREVRGPDEVRRVRAEAVGAGCSAGLARHLVRPDLRHGVRRLVHPESALRREGDVVERHVLGPVAGNREPQPVGDTRRRDVHERRARARGERGEPKAVVVARDSGRTVRPSGDRAERRYVSTGARGDERLFREVGGQHEAALEVLEARDRLRVGRPTRGAARERVAEELRGSGRRTRRDLVDVARGIRFPRGQVVVPAVERPPLGVVGERSDRRHDVRRPEQRPSGAHLVELSVHRVRRVRPECRPQVPPVERDRAPVDLRPSGRLRERERAQQRPGARRRRARGIAHVRNVSGLGRTAVLHIGADPELDDRCPRWEWDVHVEAARRAFLELLGMPLVSQNGNAELG